MELVLPKLMAAECIWLKCLYESGKRSQVLAEYLIQHLIRFYSGESGLLLTALLAAQPGAYCQSCTGIPERLDFYF